MLIISIKPDTSVGRRLAGRLVESCWPPAARCPLSVGAHTLSALMIEANCGLSWALCQLCCPCEVHSPIRRAVSCLPGCPLSTGLSPCPQDVLLLTQAQGSLGQGSGFPYTREGEETDGGCWSSPGFLRDGARSVEGGALATRVPPNPEFRTKPGLLNKVAISCWAEPGRGARLWESPGSACIQRAASSWRPFPNVSLGALYSLSSTVRVRSDCPGQQECTWGLSIVSDPHPLATGEL